MSDCTTVSPEEQKIVGPLLQQETADRLTILNPDISWRRVMKRRKCLWMQGARPKSAQAYLNSTVSTLRERNAAGADISGVSVVRS